MHFTPHLILMWRPNRHVQSEGFDANVYQRHAEQESLIRAHNALTWDTICLVLCSEVLTIVPDAHVLQTRAGIYWFGQVREAFWFLCRKPALADDVRYCRRPRPLSWAMISSITIALGALACCASAAAGAVSVDHAFGVDGEFRKRGSLEILIDSKTAVLPTVQLSADAAEMEVMNTKRWMDE